MRANDAICGIVLIFLAAVMIALAATLPEFPGQKYGPALFPRVLASGLVLCGELARVYVARAKAVEHGDLPRPAGVERNR